MMRLVLAVALVVLCAVTVMAAAEPPSSGPAQAGDAPGLSRG